MTAPGQPYADDYLRSLGIGVEPQDIAGLYRINGGPVLTHGQLTQELGRMVLEAILAMVIVWDPEP